MINSIRGILTGTREDRLFLLTGGIEWEIAASVPTLRSLPATGEEAVVYIHLYHREDQMKLYGFGTEDEKVTFLDLLKVPGIGPRQALRVLSGIRTEELRRSLEAGDVDTLARVPGLGKKTASKIILSLKGKLSFAGESGEAGSVREDLVRGLTEMGFDRKEVVEAVRIVSGEVEEENLKQEEREQEIIRRSIVRLSS